MKNILTNQDLSCLITHNFPSKSKGAGMEILPFYYDTECHYNATTGYIHDFVGVKCNGIYATFGLEEFESVIRSTAKKYSDKAILAICYNYHFDGNLLEYCTSIKKNYSKYKAKEYTDFLINGRKEDKPKFPLFDRRFKDLPNVFFYDECAETKGTDISGSIGSLEYHATRMGFKWNADIDSDIYQYNKDDINSLEQIFLHQGGIDNAKTLLYIATNVIQMNTNILSIKLFVFMFSRKYRINVSPKLPETIKALSDFKVNFKLPFEATYSNNSFLFEKKDPDGNTIKNNLLCKYRFVLNKGGLHFGLKNTHWVSRDGYLLFNLDFASLYPMIMCSDLCPVLTQHGKTMFLNFINERIDAKHKGDKESTDSSLNILFHRGAGLKKLLNSLYGATKKKHKYATEYVTFIAQVSIAWLCTYFDSLDTTVIDVNTDGIIIHTKKTKLQVYDIVNIFNVKNETTFHKSKIEVQELSEVFYKDYNNYLYLSDGKVSKVKGSFLTSRKIQKKVDKETGEMTNGYVVCNYDSVIKKWLEEEILLPASVLGFEGGHKIQRFDGLPMTITEIPNPTLSSKTIVDESGYASPLDISKACVKGFYSHFSNSDDLKGYLKESSIFDDVYTRLDVVKIKQLREVGKLFIPYNSYTELTKSYRYENLTTYDEAIKVGKKHIMLGLSTVLIPNDRNPICILDFDVKSGVGLIEADSIRSSIWAFLESLGELVLYAEIKTGSRLDADGVRRSGIHAFITFPTYKLIFTKKMGGEYKQYLDSSFLRITSKKDITLYISGAQCENSSILTIGDMNKVVQLFEGEILNKEETKKDFINTHSGLALKVMKETKKINKTYGEWLVFITSLIDDLMIHNVPEVETIVFEFNNRVSNQKYLEEEHQKNTITTIRSLVNSHQARKEENRLYSLESIHKKNKSLKVPEKLLCEIENIDLIYNHPNSIESSFDKFFDSTNLLNVLKSVTGSGKTTNLIATLVKRILDDKPFVFTSNSKINVDSVYREVLHSLGEIDVKKNSQFSQMIISNSYLLSSNTSKFFVPTKFIFTTHHYFLPTPNSTLYKPTSKILQNESFKYDFFIDELDAFLSDSEFIISSGARYIDGVGSGFSKIKKKTEYCPVKNPPQNKLSTNESDNRNICKQCIYFSSNEPKYEKNYLVGYYPLDEIRVGDESQEKKYYDFTTDLDNTNINISKEYKTRDLFKQDIVFKSKKQNGKEYKVHLNIWENSLFQTLFTYHATIDGHIELDTNNTNCEEYPHYACNVGHWTGVNTTVLKSMYNYCKINKKNIYGLSATINKTHMVLLKSVFGDETKLKINKTCVVKSQEITIYNTTDKIEISNALIDLPFKKKVICFFSKKVEAERKYKEMKSINDKVCYFNVDGFNTNSNNINLDVVKFVMSYSKGNLGRGISLLSDVCIVDCSIYKPNHSYVLYTKEKKELHNQKITHMISYILQNLGRVIRDTSKKHIVLAKCPTALAEFIKVELKAKSKNEIKVESVSDMSFINIMKKISSKGI